MLSLERGLLVWAIAATVLAVWLIVEPTEWPQALVDLNALVKNPESSVTDSPSAATKKNVVFMVSDGMGPASLSMARSFRQHVQRLDPLSSLVLDAYQIGHSRTRSSDSLVTDSAAGATAFSCALKTYNGAIGVDPDGQPCATVMEAAKLAGYATGMVVTTRITDATPASFASHAHYRSEEDFIAEQLVGSAHPWGRMVDVLIGGGRCHFLPASHKEGCRQDHRDLVAEAQEAGWTYMPHLPKGNEQLPLMSLLARGDISFELDRDPSRYPSLRESALAAINALEQSTADSDHGFFLLVEGSRIDHAGHSNDPAAQVHEVLAYDDTFKAIIDWAEQSSTPTVVLSTSDHETGGLSVARQVSPHYPDYLWYPGVLANVSQSTEYLASHLRHHAPEDPEQLAQYIEDNVLGSIGLGLDSWTELEIKKLCEHHTNAHDLLAQMLSERAQIGWATHGHSAVDVNVYGWASNHSTLEPLLGGNENIDLGKFMQDHLSLPTEPLTPLLRAGFGDKF